MKLYFVVFFLILMFASFCSAQINPGARQIALAHSDLALADDVFSLFNNPSGLAQLGRSELGIYISPAPFGLKELSNLYAAVQVPTSIGSIALGFMSYGFDLYKENQFALSYASKVTDDFYLGVTALYQNLSIKRYGSDNAVTFNLGGLVYLRDDLHIGFALSNITRATYGDEQEQIPVSYAAGVSYNILSNLTINSTLIKELEFPAEVSFGIEYKIIEFLDLRFGLSDHPNSFSSGIGINYSFLQLDYALFTHQDLGLTHQVGVIIEFGEESPQKSKAEN